jgi:AcrR family transcriptional regulator
MQNTKRASIKSGSAACAAASAAAAIAAAIPPSRLPAVSERCVLTVRLVNYVEDKHLLSERQVGGRRMPVKPRRSDTRKRIQQVALGLFAEKGYEGTSVREIAGRLGLTTAALYYHFKSKEDILRSLLVDLDAELGSLSEWGKSQPSTVEVQQELLRRLANLMHGDVLRFLQRNQGELQSLGAGPEDVSAMNEILRVLTGGSTDVGDILRATLAIIGIFTVDQIADALGRPNREEERAAVALAIAVDLISK